MIFRLNQSLTLVVTALLLLVSAKVEAQILSSKRGFADTGANYNNLQATGAGWFYRWGPDKPNIGNFDAQFMPMIWGGYQANQPTIDMIKNYGDTEWVLGFNEPERPDQANLTVAQAISAWTTLSNGFAGTGIKLVSPAVADTGGATGGQTWLANFMSQAATAGLQVDAVAFHWYGVSTPNDPVGAANSFLSRVDSYHNSYNKPVFITEFAIHDWGNLYSDAEMIEANRQFLDIVVPALESRSYVEGYAWYNWFSDSALFGGTPSVPTTMGHTYVGSLATGEVENISGQDLGQHVAYLTGGELTMNSGAPGTVRYINALANVSTISGTQDWGLTTGNWVRIQPGATLRKDGPNEITFGVSTRNNGVLTVSEGSLLLKSSVLGTGNTIVNGGTLRMEGLGRIDGPLIDIRPGGTLDLTGLNNTFTVASSQTLNNDSNSTVVGNVSAGSGSIVSGKGIFAGNLTAQSGSTVRVGGVGISSTPSHVVIDNFESYNPGKLNAGVTGGVWTGVFDGTANAQIVGAAGNSSLEYYGTGSSWRGASTNLESSFGANDFSLDDGETGTYFFRVQRQGTATIDGIFGLTDLASIGTGSPWQELAVTLSLFKGTAVGDTTSLRALDDDGSGDLVILNNIASNQWYNVWLVVNNDDKTFEVATSTGTNSGTLFPNTFHFGRSDAVGADLITFAGAEFRSVSNPANASVRIDDLYFLDGENLSNPLSTSPVFMSQIMSVTGDYTQNAGATLELDLFSPSVLDQLSVGGHLTADGTLNVLLAGTAPTPQVGNAFDILNFSSISGSFASLNLPALNSGLAWNVSNLLTTGELEVVVDVDLDNDGDVDGRDFLILQQTDPLLLTAWQAQYGDQLVTPLLAPLTAVPEPNSVLFLLLAVPSLACCRAREVLFSLAV